MTNRNEDVKPPRWAERILEWYCKPQVLEDLQGDLNEYFMRNVNSKGKLRARLIYVLDVIKFFRPYTVRIPAFNLLTQWIMIGSYIKTSGRNIMRNSLFSTINIVGLAISMSVGLLMIVFLSDLLSYDDFHVHKDSIYRVNTHNQYLDHPPMDLASTSVKAGLKIKESFTGIEHMTILRRGFAGDGSVGEKVTPLSGIWADSAFFNVFTFPMIEGNPSSALTEPYSIVLTEKSAKKLFGDASALGKSIHFDTVEYVVTGVIKDVPKLSHLRFESLVSFSTIELQRPDSDGDFYGWESVYSNYVYLLLEKTKATDQVQADLDKLSDAENRLIHDRKLNLWLQSLSHVVVGRNLSNPPGPTIHVAAIWVLGGLALIVILSACFNYTNLSIARSLRRSREVGIRKVVGARRTQVMFQFIMESVLIAILALVFSSVMFFFLRTQFISLSDFIGSIVSLEISLKLILYFILLAIGVGILAGCLPALFFSRINASQVLKDLSSLKLFRNLNFRKALLITQYSFSLMFITTTIIGYNQYKSFLSFDLGFRTENIYNVRMQGNKDELLIQELSKIPAVDGISRSRIITSTGSMYGTMVKYKNPADSTVAWQNFVDEQYIPLHGHVILAGRNLSSLTGTESEVLVNEQLLKRFDIAHGDPQKAVGESIKADGLDLTIVGVMKDFHYGTVENKIEPVMFRYSRAEPNGFLNIKIATTDIAPALKSIEQAWKKVDHVHPIQASFYDQQIAANYDQFSVMIKVIGFLAFLAVCISSMGLFGMVVFTTETRLKEISIRKVLGASERRLVILLSKSFLIMLTISGLIALPATYLLFDQVVLVNFVYHEPVTFFELFAGLIGVMAIAFLMIGFQTLRVARTNPATVLKTE
jgi:putative ABC transport system permease protein